MSLNHFRVRPGQKQYPEASNRYVDRVLGTERDPRILSESFAASETGYGSDHVIKPAGELFSPVEMWDVRCQILTRLARVGLHLGTPLKDKEKTLWDRVVGAALLECLDMRPYQLFGEDAWTYLSVHLLPEFADWRFPGRQSQGSDADERVRPRDRVLGGRRNVLFRVWFRAWVLGPDLRQPERADALGEDELDNIFGRPAISRNHEFTRRIVDTVYRNSPRSNETRRQAVRELLKEIRRKYSTVHFTSLGEDLDELLDAMWAEAVTSATAVLTEKRKQARAGSRESR